MFSDFEGFELRGSGPVFRGLGFRVSGCGGA